MHPHAHAHIIERNILKGTFFFFLKGNRREPVISKIEIFFLRPTWIHANQIVLTLIYVPQSFSLK